jgi:hypothetical protein
MATIDGAKAYIDFIAHFSELYNSDKLQRCELDHFESERGSIVINLGTLRSGGIMSVGSEKSISVCGSASIEEQRHHVG